MFLSLSILMFFIARPPRPSPQESGSPNQLDTQQDRTWRIASIVPPGSSVRLFVPSSSTTGAALRRKIPRCEGVCLSPTGTAGPEADATLAWALISIDAAVVVLVLRWRLRPLGAPWGAC